MCLNTQRRYERVVLTYRALWRPRQRLQRQGGGAAARVAAARGGRLWQSDALLSYEKDARADEASSGGDAAADNYEERSNYRRHPEETLASQSFAALAPRMEFRKQTARSSGVRQLAAMPHFLRRMRRRAACRRRCQAVLPKLETPAALELTLAHFKYGRFGFF